MGKARGQQQRGQQQRGVQIELVGEEYMPRVYANFCQLRTSPYDVSLVFGEIAPGSETAQQEVAKTGKAQGKAKAVIAIPHQMLPGLIRALQTVADAYQRAQQARAQEQQPPQQPPGQ